MLKRFILLVTLGVVSGGLMALDQPDFIVLETFAATENETVEIRQYPAFTVASVAIDGDIKDAGNKGFRLLADYIFGNNEADEKIAMTAPVFQSRIADDSQKVSFYLTESTDSVPTPVNSRVAIESSEMTVAVVRYKGGWGIRKYEEHLEKLVAQLDLNDSWQISGEAIWARYDPPFKPPWWRTNEVMLPVSRVP